MKKRPLICVIAADCTNQFMSLIINGITAQAFICGCDVAILSPLTKFFNPEKGEHRQAEMEIYKLILSDEFDGYIYCKSDYSMDIEVVRYIEALLKKTNKFVMVADGTASERFDYTKFDDFDDFKLIVDHLIEVHGYKKIYCLTGRKGMFQAEERLKGYFSSMEKHGLYYNESYYDYGDFWKIYPKEFAERIISGRLEKPEAVACANDTMAYALIESLEAAGIHVPEDIAVTGYDNCTMGQHSVSLTSFQRDNTQLGADCMRRLYKNITGRLCRRFENKDTGFVVGRSCGCTGVALEPKKKRRHQKLYEVYHEQMDYSDMLFDVSAAGSTEELFRLIDSHTHMIYKLKQINFFLTQSFSEAITQCESPTLEFNLDTIMKPVYSRKGDFTVSFGGDNFNADSILSYFGEEFGKPRAFYISLLHFGKKFFGAVSLSFGKDSFRYDIAYMYYIRYIEAALDKLLCDSIYKNTLQIQHYIPGTEFFDLYGLYEWAKSAKSMPNGVFICCEIVDIKGLYGKYGSEKIQNIVRSFSVMLADSLSENEVCGMASFDRICAFVTSKKHSQKIFHFIKKKISSSSTPFTFTYGETIADYSRIQDMSDMYSLVGEALNNTTHSFTIHSCGNRELYEKLYHLRREIESKPEYPWNINEMCRKLNISKSTIQKNYKEYFGKSIFEDLIQFRIEKSKHLLTETDTSISEIAVLCGYSSDSYFMKQFKKEVGVTPTQYRKKYP